MYVQRLRQLCETILSQPDSVSYYNWMYDDGVVLKGLEYAEEITADPRIFPYTKAYVDHFVTEDGRIPAVEKRPPSADCINNGKVIFHVFRRTGEQRYETALRYLYDYILKHPRLHDVSGFAHKAVYPDQMWLDGLYMMEPLYAEFVREWGPADRFKDIADQFAYIEQFTYDEDKQLFYHAYDHSRRMFWCDPATGHSPCFWGRAMGWLGMAAVDALDYIPDSFPKQRAILIRVLNKLCDGLLRYQNQNGVWYQVVDQGGRTGNYEEASCSCMYAYTLKKGVQKGYLAPSFDKAAQRAMDGIWSRFVTEDASGLLHIHQVCQVAGLGPEKKPERDGSYEYYIGEPVVDDDNKAVGALLCALSVFARQSGK